MVSTDVGSESGAWLAQIYVKATSGSKLVSSRSLGPRPTSHSECVPGNTRSLSGGNRFLRSTGGPSWYVHHLQGVSMKVLGNILFVIGSIAGAGIWLLTAGIFFSRGDVLLGLLALLVPPADLILPFFISLTFGLFTLGTGAVVLLGMWMRGNDE